jgi:hypothetical protein
MSKRSQKRSDYLNKNAERIQKLIDKFGTSDNISNKINELENKPLNGAELRELEGLHSQFRLLREYERLNTGKEVNIAEKLENGRLELGKRSIFFDTELNAAGIQPKIVEKNYVMKHSITENKQFLFETNIQEEIEFPKEDKPQFYKIKGLVTEYSNK